MCDRELPEPPPRDDPLAYCTQKDGQLFNTRGKAVVWNPDEFDFKPHYRLGGEVVLGPLDSEIYRCQWHRIILGLQALPVGCSITVSTYTDEQIRPIDELGGLWTHAITVSGSSENPDEFKSEDALVQSREGRYCWLHLELRSDGFGTPRLRVLEGID